LGFPYSGSFFAHVSKKGFSYPGREGKKGVSGKRGRPTNLRRRAPIRFHDNFITRAPRFMCEREGEKVGEEGSDTEPLLSPRFPLRIYVGWPFKGRVWEVNVESSQEISAPLRNELGREGTALEGGNASKRVEGWIRRSSRSGRSRHDCRPSIITPLWSGTGDPQTGNYEGRGPLCPSARLSVGTREMVLTQSRKICQQLPPWARSLGGTKSAGAVIHTGGTCVFHSWKFSQVVSRIENVPTRSDPLGGPIATFTNEA